MLLSLFDEVQRNRDPPPTAAGLPQWDTDKVVALMLRSHTVVPSTSMESLDTAQQGKTKTCDR